MLNSRNVGKLRPDVAANCRALIALAKEAGYSVLVTGTVRDTEYQTLCYNQGNAGSKVPSFHSVKAGLAFDICQKVKGREYSDNTFWQAVGAIGKRLGFTWGGDWKSIVDKPHFQWDDHGKCTGAMVRSGKYPAAMPAYQEDEMTYEQFCEYMDKYMSVSGTGDKPSAWAREATEDMKEAGVFNGDGQGNYGWQKPITREALAVVLYNSK